MNEHKNENVEGFAKKYNLKKLVYFESHGYVFEALTREKRLKKWHRS
jgi:putative endonuclease